MKVLGFVIGATPNMNEQVESLKKRFRSRAWVIRHLKRAGLSECDLIKMYKTLVRPVLDYMAAVYHPMLTREQKKELERLQMGCLKTIFGYEKSYRETLEKGRIQSLEERRQDIFDKFAVKLAKNPDYQHWLPKTSFTGYDLREELIFTEHFAATERLRNSPLYAIRRRLNEIYLHESNKTASE